MEGLTGDGWMHEESISGRTVGEGWEEQEGETGGGGGVCSVFMHQHKLKV